MDLHGSTDMSRRPPCRGRFGPVTNMARVAENVVGVYNKRGTCEQYIKEGKGAIK